MGDATGDGKKNVVNSSQANPRPEPAIQAAISRYPARAKLYPEIAAKLSASYPFQTGLAGQQLQQRPPLQHPRPSQQPQQSTNSPNPLPLNSTTPNLGTNRYVSLASEVGLDPNDFPALGSTPATNSTSNQMNLTQNSATSYATQASGATVTGSGNTQSGATSLTTGFPCARGLTNDPPTIPMSTPTSRSFPSSGSQRIQRPESSAGYNQRHHSEVAAVRVLNIGQQRLHLFTCGTSLSCS